MAKKVKQMANFGGGGLIKWPIFDYGKGITSVGSPGSCAQTRTDPGIKHKFKAYKPQIYKASA